MHILGALVVLLIAGLVGYAGFCMVKHKKFLGLDIFVD